MKNAKSLSGKTIVVTYDATLNADAVIGDDGNTNKVSVKYSNNPNWDGTGESEPTGETPEDEVVTFTFELDVTKTAAGEKVETGKTDEEGNAITNSKTLEGAEFILYKTVTKDGEEVKYYLTATEATVTTTDDDGGETTSGTGVYTVTGWTAEESDATKLTSASNGIFEIKGLDTGTYYLKETKAPDGYNLLADPIKLVISATYEDTDNDGLNEVKNLTATADNNSLSTSAAAGTISATIENNAGSTLPSTGGIGTTIFYVVGTILVLGAAVLLITRRRMSKAE